MTRTTMWSDETRQAVEAALNAVRETPTADGRTVWDLLTDDRSREAVIVAERYVAGMATDEEMSVAAWAASGAAWDTSDVAAAAAAWAAAAAAAAAARAAADAAAAAAMARAATYAAHAAAAARTATAQA